MTSHKLAILAAVLAAGGAGFLNGPDISRSTMTRDPEPEIYGSRNDRRSEKRRAQKQARKRNKK